MADLDADSVSGPKDIWKFQFPGYSVVLGIVGKCAWSGGMYDDVMTGEGVVDVPGVDTSL